ncbi:unnamed protein product [Camellia sinensis]
MQVVRFVNDEIGISNSLGALVIINSLVEQRHQVESTSRTARKHNKNGNEMEKFLSLEDQLMFMKESGTTARGNEAKRARRSCATSSSHSFEARCHVEDTNPLLPVKMVEHLKKGIGAWGQMVHVEKISARVACHVEIPNELSEKMKYALKCIGITRLYSHQSVRASLAGKHVVVATMTSSGEISLLQSASTRSIVPEFVSALAQDQLRALLAMTKDFDTSLDIGIYDGDTSHTDRIWLRDNARLLITNPDMLNMSILPFHGQFRRILSNLRFVVIDEAHTYKGAFGCHTALILRRLRRLCFHVYGSDPSFHFCTATSANPREHAMDRRRIESEFFSRNLCGVAATNASELGIDVGHIDAILHLGFPGGIASMVHEQHLVCAAVEHSLSFLHDEIYFGHRIKNAMMALKSKGYLIADPSRDSPNRIWSYIGHEKMPSHNVSIRAIETEKYKVIVKQKNEVLEEIEESKAFFQVYDSAVYMHQGKTYLVKELDISSKIALCQLADLKYYTKTHDYTDVHVIGGKIAYPARISNIQLSRTTSQVNTCKVTTTWFGFYRIWRGSNQIFDAVDLLLPTHSYESQAVWIRVPQSIKAAVEIKNLSFRAGLHAADHALLNVIPLHPGGTGISAQVQPIFTELLTAALELLTSCRCSADTSRLACHEHNEVLHKDAAIIIIKGVLDAEKSYFNELS